MARVYIVMLLSACRLGAAGDPDGDGASSNEDTHQLVETDGPDDADEVGETDRSVSDTADSGQASDSDTASIDHDPCEGVSVSVDIVDIALAPQRLRDQIASDDGSWSGPATWSDLQTTQLSVEITWDTAHVEHRYQSVAGDGVATPGCLDEWATPASLQVESTDGRLDHAWDVEMRGMYTTELYNVALGLGVIHADIQALLAPGDDELLFSIQWDNGAVDGGHAFSGHGGLRSHEVLAF